ncbi:MULTISPECIES: vWA domain-containing protein [unclassified Streptomyces]|uniref:vWA domain-containing protein n=1 Tax=unclassified Streptomyces TaxID=2593676 RepID=UPI0032543726
MASRPVHFIWLLDCSGSMSVNGKIAELNFAIREAIPEMQSAARSNPGATLLVRAVSFASGASWHINDATPVDQFTWEDLHTYGGTDMGAAFRLAAGALQTPPMPQRALPPVLALVSDGQPTDDWRSGLRAIDDTPWGKRAVRVALAIGDDADKSMLKEFLANPELEPLQAKNPRQLAAAIRWMSTAVKAASTPKGDGGGPVQAPPPVALGKDEDEDPVW